MTQGGTGFARTELVSLLRRAHAGELAAASAYGGHWRSLRAAEEIAAIQRIEREEMEHRDAVGEMLEALGSAPAPWRERFLFAVGMVAARLCRVSGWFMPMYVAGRLERGNVQEYESAAALALALGEKSMSVALRGLAAVEAEHERYFQSKVESHWMGALCRFRSRTAARLARTGSNRFRRGAIPRAPLESLRRARRRETVS